MIKEIYKSSLTILNVILDHLSNEIGSRLSGSVAQKKRFSIPAEMETLGFDSLSSRSDGA
jgi:hypothetical protein